MEKSILPTWDFPLKESLSETSSNYAENKCLLRVISQLKTKLGSLHNLLTAMTSNQDKLGTLDICGIKDAMLNKTILQLESMYSDTKHIFSIITNSMTVKKSGPKDRNGTMKQVGR